MSRLLLSIFPGIDLLGRGFEAEGFCVVRGPDKIWGGDIFEFHPPPGKFEGVIGGAPCQNFTTVNPARDFDAGCELLREFVRVVVEAQPAWWLLENVPGVPPVEITGYQVQRFFINAAECGGRQFRNRRIQFGSRDAAALVCDRAATRAELARTCLANEGQRTRQRMPNGAERPRRSWAEFCDLQGLPANFELPGMVESRALSRRGQRRAGLHGPRARSSGASIATGHGA